jgi:UDP:flavonoid glycosyltransferase YjiC (YdhE family)
MPFCWDGLDNASRIHDTGFGEQLPRYSWTDTELTMTIDDLLSDDAMQARLQILSTHMQMERGTDKAAKLLLESVGASKL